MITNFGEEEGGEGRKFGGFEDDGIAGGESGGNFPTEHEEGEVPGNDLSAYTNWLIAREFFGGELGPSGMVVKMSSDEGDVDVAGFADGFSVIEGFEDSEEASVLLDLSRDCVEVFGAALWVEGLPGGEGGLGGLDGLIDMLGGGLGNLSEFCAIGGVKRGEHVLGFYPLVVDE